MPIMSIDEQHNTPFFVVLIGDKFDICDIPRIENPSGTVRIGYFDCFHIFWVFDV